MKSLLLIVFLIISFKVYTQSTANYTFSTSSDASLTDMSSGTTLLVSPNTDGLNTGIFSGTNPIGFTFYFMSMPYDQFVATEDGVIRLGTSLASVNRTPELNVNEPRLIPFSCDMGTGGNGKVHYKTTGSAPNRVCIVEWLNNYGTFPASMPVSGLLTFQVRLYEATGKIEYVYGYMNMQRRRDNSDLGGIGFCNSNASDGVIYKTGNFSSPAVGTTIPVTLLCQTNITATGEVAGLSSSTDGARRIYNFVPRTAPDAPTTLTYSAISQSSVTLHWVDNSVNETHFHIYRSDDGGTTFELAMIVPANTTTSGPISGLPDKTYYWRVIAVNEGACSSALEGSCSTLPAGTIYSTATGGLWSQPATWQGGVLPGTNDDVIIKDGATVTIDIPTAVCNNITVGEGTSGSLRFIAGSSDGILTCDGDVWVRSGGSFDVIPGATGGIKKLITGQRYYANGNLKVDGNFNMDAGGSSIADVEFRGTVDGTISGSGATCNFYSITVNKGTTSDKSIEATRVITMSSPASTASRLNITNGTFKLSSASVLTPYFGNQTICGATGRIWINNSSGSVQCVGTGTATGAGNPTINGTLQVTAGTFGYGSGNNTCTVNGTLQVDGPNGIVNIFGRLTFAGAGYCNIFDGNVNVDPQAANNLAAGNVVDFPSLTTVLFTGGMLTIIDPNANAGSNEFNIASSEQNKFFTGATIRFGNGVSSTSGNANGFTIAVPGQYQLLIGNVIVNNPAGTNRSVRMTTTSAGTPTLNDLTITAGTFNLNGIAINVAGDNGFVNNGSLVATTANSRINFTGTNPQTYSGTGTLNNTNLTTEIRNPSGLTLQSPFSTMAIIFTSGLLYTTSTNLISVTGTTAGNVSVTGTASYTSGPFARNIVNGAGTWVFPVGKSAYTFFEILNPATTGTVMIQAEVFDANCSGTITTPPGYELNSNRYWAASAISGSTYTSGTIRINETNPTTNQIITQAAAVSGVYTGIHGSQAGNTLTSVAATPGLGYICAAAPGFLSGTYNVGSGQPFTSLTNNDAQGFFRTVNNTGLKGNVTLIVTSDLTETGAVALNQWAEINGSGFTITINPDGTTVRNITGSAASGATLISINGADRLKIDGINRYLLFRNTRGTATQTGPTIQFNNSSNTCKISNCIIESNASTATTGVIVFGTTGTNNNDTIEGCLVRQSTGATTGNPANSVYNNTTANCPLVFSGNEFCNFSNSGILSSNSGVGLVITGNHFYNNLAPTSTQTCIAITGASGNGHEISGNFFGGSGPSCSGTWTNSGNITFKAISLNSGSGTVNSVQGNTISGINLSNNGNAVNFYGIEIASGPANIGTATGNIIGSNTAANSIQFAGQRTFVGIYSNSTSSVSIWNNVIANVSCSSNNVNQTIKGIQHNGTGSANISSNIIHDLSTNSTKIDINDMAVQGIYYSGASTGSCFITENQIYNLSILNNTTAQINASGISVTSVTSPVINRNRIWNISNASTRTTAATPPTASGINIYRPAASSAVEIRNNMISLGSGLTTNTEFNGIWLQSSTNAYTANCTFNTVYIGGVASSGALNSFAFLRGDNSATTQGVSLNLINNIFANSRTGGTGTHYSVGNQGTTPSTNWTSSGSNYNLYIGNNAGVIALWNSTNNDLPAFRTNTGGDASSISLASTAGMSDYRYVNSSQLFSNVSSGDLHINTANTEAWFANGKGNQHTIANDIDNDARSTAVITGSTDLGADEFTPASTPVNAGQTGTISNGSTTTYTFAGRTIAEITWHGSDLPASVNLYYYTQKFPDLNDGFGVPYPNLVGAKYSDCVWEITPNGGNFINYTYDLKLYYDNSLTGTVDDLTAARIAKNPYRYPDASAAPVYDYGVYPSTYNAGTKSYFKSGIIDFSKFIIYQGPAIELPVNLVSFQGTCSENDVLLTWITSSEINNDYFTVESSYDGEMFVKVAEIDGSGTTNTSTMYTFTDEMAFATSQVIYYRLKQTDFNSEFKYSDIIAVKCNGSDIESLNIGFEPGSIWVYFNGMSGQEYTLLLYDNSGKLLKQKKFYLESDNAEIPFDISNIVPGSYHLVVSSDQQVKSKQIIILRQ